MLHIIFSDIYTNFVLFDKWIKLSIKKVKHQKKTGKVGEFCQSGKVGIIFNPIKRSAVVTLEVIWRNPLHAGDEACY